MNEALLERCFEERQKAVDAGHDLDRVLSTDDLVTGDNAFFVATGITTGEMLGGVRCTLVSPDGALLIAGGVRGELAAWRLDTGQAAAAFGGVGAGVRQHGVLDVLDEGRGVERAVEDVAEPEHEARGAAEGRADGAGDHVVRTAALHLAVGHDGREGEGGEDRGGEGEGEDGGDGDTAGGAEPAL